MCNPRREQAAERQIQKQVLHLLQQVGPTNYKVRRIGTVGRMVCITVAGYRRLDDMKYWSKAFGIEEFSFRKRTHEVPREVFTYQPSCGSAAALLRRA